MQVKNDLNQFFAAERFQMFQDPGCIISSARSRPFKSSNALFRPLIKYLIPTTFLIRIMAKFEVLYTAYSRLLFGFSLSDPVCMSVVLFGENYVAQSLSWLCWFRILESPILLVAMGISRFTARFDQAKRLGSWALLIEGLTLALPVSAFAVALFIPK